MKSIWAAPVIVSILILGLIGFSQDAFANHTNPGAGTTLHCDITTNPPVPDVDYSNCNLSGADLSGANLSGADLSKTNLNGADFSNADLSGANLSSAQARFSAADFSGADLSGADIRARLPGADFSGADLSGANLANVDLSGADLSGANISGSNLIFADLPGADLTGADLSSSNLIGVDLSGADLSGADFTGAFLERMILGIFGGVTCGAGTTESAPDANGIKICTADVTLAQLNAALAERDAVLAELSDLFTRNSCNPSAVTIQAVIDCITNLNTDLATAKADLDAANQKITELESILLSGEITICHKGKTQTVSLAAYGTHVGHGDFRGACL